MDTIIVGSDKKLVNFYSAYMDILGVESEVFTNVAKGVKQASLRKDVYYLIMVLHTKEDYLEYSRLKVYLDENKKNIIIIYTNDVLLKLVTSSKIITYSHKDITRNFASAMSKIHLCEPYMKEVKKERTPEMVLGHIKVLLTKGNVILPVKNECAVHVLSALDHDDVSFKKIDGMTKTDPIMHSCLIKMANSVYYCTNYCDIDNVEKALIRVGITNVKVFLINYINKSLAINKNLLFTSEIDSTIDTSLKIASLCYVLSDYFNVSSREVMFSIGLLSRLGEIFIYAAISAYLEGENLNVSELKEYMDIADKNFHTVGGMMLKKWKFSANYYMPILNSHTMTSNKHMEETKLLHLAESMLHFLVTNELNKTCRDALIVTGLELTDEELFDIRRNAGKHLVSIKALIM